MSWLILAESLSSIVIYEQERNIVAIQAKRFRVGIFSDNEVIISTLRQTLELSKVLVFRPTAAEAPSLLEWGEDDQELIDRIMDYSDSKQFFLNNCSHLVVELAGVESFSMLGAAVRALIANEIITLTIVGNLSLEGLVALGEDEEKEELRTLIESERLRIMGRFGLASWIDKLT